MSVSIMDMQDMATSLPEVSISNDIGNVIEVNDVGDDLGMNLLANSRFSGGGGGSSGGISLNTGGASGMSMNVNPIGGSAFEEVDVQRMDSLPSISLDFNQPAPSNPTITIQRETSSYQPANSFGSDGSQANQQSASGPSINLAPPGPPRDVAKENETKSDLINKLQRLEAKGFPVAKRFTMDNSLDEIKAEQNRLVDARKLETSIRFQRNMLMGVVTGMQFLNDKFDPFDLKLDGWSEGVHENIEDYDEIFEELYDKYKERGNMPPEARLLFQLAGSGFMCHVSNTFFRAKMPSADDIFKKNPELAKQFAAAAAQQASPGFGNFMGMAMGVPPQQEPSASTVEGRERAQPGPMGVPVGMASGPASTGAFFNSPQMPQQQAAQPPPQVARREMKGPSGVDDILRTFEEVRMAEESSRGTVNFDPPTPTMGPAQTVAEEIASVASGDLGSIMTDRTGGGRRKKRSAPVGNVVSLNV